MQIVNLNALPIGNAIAVDVAIPLNIVWLQIARRREDEPYSAQEVFSGPDDLGATLIYNSPLAPAPRMTMARIMDDDVANDVAYCYIAYGHNDQQWQASQVKTITPGPHFLDRTVDVLNVVRERLALGLAAEVEAGRLTPKTGQVPVWAAPPLVNNTPWPVVTVRLDQDASVERYIGEMVDMDQDDISGVWAETEGWQSRVTLTIIGWSLNPDERNDLRRALKRIIIGNLPVFAAAGLTTPDWNQQDSEDFEQFSAPVYQTVGTFSCLALSALTGLIPAIEDVTVIGTSTI